LRHVFYTNGNSRDLKIGNRVVTLKHVNPSRLVAAGTMTGIVFSALMFLGKKNVTTKIVAKVHKQLTAEEFESVLKQIKNMPAWMADVFYQYVKEKKNG